MDAMIPLGEALQHMDSGQPFSMTVVTADITRGTGGELKHYTHCVKLGTQQLTKKVSAALATEEARIRKAPRHYKNSSRNIQLTNTGEVKKIHIRLIVRYNGKRVS